MSYDAHNVCLKTDLDEVDEKSREPDLRDSYVQEDAQVNFGRFGS